MSQPIILPLEKEDQIEIFLPPGFINKERKYELGESLEIFEYHYPNDAYSVIYDYYDERIIIIQGEIAKILDEIEQQVLDKIAEKHGDFEDDQLDYNYCIEVFYPDYWTASSDDHSISSNGYWDYIEIELYRPAKISSSLMKIEKVKIKVPAWVSIGKIYGTKIVSVCSDALLNIIAKLLNLKLE